MSDQAYVVVAPAGVVERFRTNCEHAGLTFWCRPVQVGATSAGTEDQAHDAGVTKLLASIPQVAEVLDVSDATVKRLIRKGELPAVKVEGATRVRCADLADYVERLNPMIECAR